jgi:hypothetical protein
MPGILYENQYGFAHEEWLFNTRYHIGGYQYGYIRGLCDHHPPGNRIDRVYLYSVQEEDHLDRVYYIGYIDEVEILGDQWRIDYPEVADTYDGYEHVVNQEIREAGGDPSGLDSHEFRPVLRFKIDKANLMAAPVMVNDFPLERYPGFGAYEVSPELLDLFNRVQV